MGSLPDGIEDRFPNQLPANETDPFACQADVVRSEFSKYGLVEDWVKTWILVMPFSSDFLVCEEKMNQPKSLKFTSTNMILKMSHEVSSSPGLLLEKSGSAVSTEYRCFSSPHGYYLILKPIPCDSQVCRYHESFSTGVSPHLSKPSAIF